MRRELLLIGEMIEAAEQAQALVSGVDLETLTADRQRRDALMWNFTVLGEAAAQLDWDVKERFPEVPWVQPARLRNRIVHGYWSSLSSPTPPATECGRQVAVPRASSRIRGWRASNKTSPSPAGLGGGLWPRRGPLRVARASTRPPGAAVTHQRMKPPDAAAA